MWYISIYFRASSHFSLDPEVEILCRCSSAYNNSFVVSLIDVQFVVSLIDVQFVDQFVVSLTMTTLVQTVTAFYAYTGTVRDATTYDAANTYVLSNSKLERFFQILILNVFHFFKFLENYFP